ncbi:MAG: CPBP family intramembrane glutamic endopeptidase [Oscillospiraceae bacterium]
MSRKKEWISLTVGFLGAMLGLYGVVSFNRYVLMSLPLGLRMAMMIVIYWLIALIPIIMALVNKEKLNDYGFTKEKIGTQIVTGAVIGIAMSLVLTLLPHLFGFGEYVDNGKRYQFIWQFVYEFIYCILAIGFVEEFVFRGFIYEKIKSISQKDMTAVIGSSVLFGVFHLFGGNIVQLFVTACIGAFFCFCRAKIKSCTILSLIIAHGIYDALITVWASTLL